MSNADKVGILPPFGWIVDFNPWLTLVVAWMITPGMVWLIAYVFEGRKPTFNRHTFLSFIPGDFCLGITFAASVALVPYLPHGGYWSSTWQWIIFIGAFIVCLLIRQIADKPNYTPRALWSPSKAYHDFFLYWLYGYMMVSVAIPAVFSTDWSGQTAGLKIIAIGAFAFWVFCLAYDNFFCSIKPLEKARHAHTDRWVPIWRR